mgnify:CR=1 FL=1
MRAILWYDSYHTVLRVLAIPCFAEYAGTIHEAFFPEVFPKLTHILNVSCEVSCTQKERSTLIHS